MASVTITDIDERLRHLPPEKLVVVYDLSRIYWSAILRSPDGRRHCRLLASEAVS